MADDTLLHGDLFRVQIAVQRSTWQRIEEIAAVERRTERAQAAILLERAVATWKPPRREAVA